MYGRRPLFGGGVSRRAGRSLKIALVLASLLSGASVGLRADCYLPSLREALKLEQTALAFDGTVRRIERVGGGTITTFDAERVWKGQVGRSISLYAYQKQVVFNCDPPSGSSLGSCGGTAVNDGRGLLSFAVGVRYVVIAHSLSREEREPLGLALDATAFGASACGEGSIPYERAQRNGLVAPLGAGYPPQLRLSQ
jgi:hypothetical protein